MIPSVIAEHYPYHLGEDEPITEEFLEHVREYGKVCGTWEGDYEVFERGLCTIRILDLIDTYPYQLGDSHKINYREIIKEFSSRLGTPVTIGVKLMDPSGKIIQEGIIPYHGKLNIHFPETGLTGDYELIVSIYFGAPSGGGKEFVMDWQRHILSVDGPVQETILQPQATEAAAGQEKETVCSAFDRLCDEKLEHYVERYITEPDYKAWFDRNFPDYTIYEGIGITQSQYQKIVNDLTKPQPAAEQAAYTMSTYVHPEQKYSIQYPSTWSVEDNNFRTGESVGIGSVIFTDSEDWTMYVEVWNLGSLPFIDTQSEQERFDGTITGERLTCMQALIVDGYECSDLEPGEHGFVTLSSGEVIHSVSYTTVREYPEEHIVEITTTAVDFLCCTNHIYQIIFDIDATNPANIPNETIFQIKQDMLESFSMDTPSGGNEIIYVLIAAVAVGGGIGAVFIIKKGSKAPTVQQKPPSRRQKTVSFCGKCGISLIPGAKFCGKCGTRKP